MAASDKLQTQIVANETLDTKHATFTSLKETINDIEGKIPSKVTDLEDHANYALTSDIPLSVSQLINDKGYVSEVDIAELKNSVQQLEVLAEGLWPEFTFNVGEINSLVKTYGDVDLKTK